jgi:hypothetical protein
MYSRRFRTPLLLLLLLASAASPAFIGWPWSIDAWISAGMHGWSIPTMDAVPLVIGLGIVLTDFWLRLVPSRSSTIKGWRMRSWWSFLLLFGAAAILLWTLRVQHWAGDFVGDKLLAEPSYSTAVVETAEPLGTVTMGLTCQLAQRLGATCATAVRVETVLYGASAVVAIALWAQLFPRPGMVFAMIALSGYMVLFCGYIEKGTIKGLALNTWYVYAGTRAVTGGRARWRHASSLFLALATLMHGSSLVWLPAHAAGIWSLPGGRERLLSIACWILPITGMVLLVATGVTPLRGNPFGTTLAFLAWTTDLCLTYWHTNTLCGQSFFSVEHAFWIINPMLTMAPVATLCIPEALLRSGASRLTLWLGLGACGWLFLLIIWHPGMGFGWFADWDIYTFTPYVVSVWTLTLASTQLRPMEFRHFSGLWIAMTLPHTWLWWRTWQTAG